MLCSVLRHLPTSLWKQLRRARICPSSKTLRRHALNQRDTAQSNFAAYETIPAQRHTATGELTAEEKKMFLDYVQSITDNRAQWRRSSLVKSLGQLKPQATFSNRPDRFVHKVSSLKLYTTLMEVLSLGLKYCPPRRRDNQL
ncbi:unnamed protein product, partial [Dicrocoelium dendriticum]